MSDICNGDISGTGFYIDNSVSTPKEVATFKMANVTFSVFEKEKIPNRFVRFMQKHILGIEWEVK